MALGSRLVYTPGVILMLSKEISLVWSNWQAVPSGETLMPVVPEAERRCSLAFAYASFWRLMVSIDSSFPS